MSGISSHSRKRWESLLSERASLGLERRVRVSSDSEALIDLSNNDYLGHSRNAEVIESARSALSECGASSSSSPLISGYKSAHESLLDSLLRWHGFEFGTIWNTGYAANQAALSLLPHKGDLALADRLIHNSVVNGLLRSGARIIRYRHCDLDHLEGLLEARASGDRSVFVVTESVFSMDGDYPDLRRLAALKRRFGFFWIVDEAHAIGWYGKKGSGLVEREGVAGEVDLLVGTMGKGIGSMGAYTLFHDELIKRYLENYASEFIYSTYLAPSCAAAAKTSISLIEKSDSLRERGQSLSRRIRSALQGIGFEVPDGDSAIVPVIVGKAKAATRAAEMLCSKGFVVGVARPPTVPEGESRLRLSLKANLETSDEARLVSAMESTYAEL